MRIVLLLLVLSTVFVSSWVIYRKSQKKKLVCREENEWEGNNSNSTFSEASAPRISSSSSSESSEESRENRRSKRDIDVDPVLKQPIIYLGTRSNSTVFIDDGDFDIVSDQLTAEEIEAVKQQIMNTCNALNSD